MKVIYTIMLSAALCAGIAQMVHASSPSKPVKIKIEKTDFASRGKPWSYRVLQDQTEETSKATPYKSIKNYVTVSYTPGPDVWLEICTGSSGQGICKRNPLRVAYPGKVLSIDREGTIEPKTADEIQKMIAVNKPTGKLVTVTVLIPVDKIKVRDTLRSTTQGGSVYGKALITDTTSVIDKINGAAISVKPFSGGETAVAEKYYSIPLKVPADSRDFSLRINNAVKKVVLRDQDVIDKQTIIKMGHENRFFVLDR